MLKFLLVRKYDVGALCNGILSGLVSITAGCGNMAPRLSSHLGHLLKL